jgi:hypothetical protein
MGPEREDEDERAAEPGMKRDADARPDDPTGSDGARSGERDRGANSEFIDGPGTLAEDPPPN